VALKKCSHETFDESRQLKERKESFVARSYKLTDLTNCWFVELFNLKIEWIQTSFALLRSCARSNFLSNSRENIIRCYIEKMASHQSFDYTTRRNIRMDPFFDKTSAFNLT